MRRFTGLILALALVSLSAGPVFGSSVTDSVYQLPKPAVQFTDLSTTDGGKVVWHPATGEILAAYNAGLVKGYPDKTFRPDANASVAEFVVIIIRLMGLEKTLDPAAYLPAGYKAPGWAVPDVAKAATLGLLGPTDTNTPITRELAAYILGQGLGLQPNSEALSFKDTGAIQQSYRGMVGAVAKAKLMVGLPDNIFDPGGRLTRAQAAIVVVRALNLGK